MLGELYKPKGLALETARAVLEVDEPYAVNVAWGCRLGCKYPCYNWFRTKGKMTFPKEPPVDLVERQLEKGIKPEGVFISFGTEPLLTENIANTIAVVNLLRDYSIRVAVLSKMGTLNIDDFEIRHGATIVSFSNAFSRTYEPNALDTLIRRQELICASEGGSYTWGSIEPYPCPVIFKQDIKPFLEELNFVDFLIFGPLNYDKRANTPEAKEFYKQAAAEFVDFCKAQGIRYHVKIDISGVERSSF